MELPAASIKSERLAVKGFFVCTWLHWTFCLHDFYHYRGGIVIRPHLPSPHYWYASLRPPLCFDIPTPAVLTHLTTLSIPIFYHQVMSTDFENFHLEKK